jgi:hypothetical protein
MPIMNSNDYFKCVQHAGQNPETHHTTLSHRDWVTIDYKHTSQSIQSTLGRSAETYPTTLSHRDWDLPVCTYWSPGWESNPRPETHNLGPEPLDQGYLYANNASKGENDPWYLFSLSVEEFDEIQTTALGELPNISFVVRKWRSSGGKK